MKMVLINSIFGCPVCADERMLFIWITGRKMRCINCDYKMELPVTLSIDLAKQGEILPENN